MKTKRINLISGPRNISTALMYSFANRPDTEVVDEPMYGYYLSYTGIKYHPGTDLILENLPHTMDEVKEKLLFNTVDKPVYFIKGMAHHYVDVDLRFLLDLDNVFLIRDPHELIVSFSRIIQQPNLDDIGLKKEWEICQFLIKENKRPIVIDSNDILENPQLKLENLCRDLNIPFSASMLEWRQGPLRQDGVWAEHWYKNVWKSTGFKKNIKKQKEPLSNGLKELYRECLYYYNALREIKWS